MALLIARGELALFEGEKAIGTVGADQFFGVRDSLHQIASSITAVARPQTTVAFFDAAKLRIKNNLPAATVGSLREKAIQMHIFQSIKNMIEAPNIKEQLSLLAHNIENIYCLRDASKHLVNRKFAFT